MKILLVDDNRFDRALVLRELQKEFPAVSVNEILDAVALEEALAADDFDLVITDYQLQWTTGSEVLRSVKQRFPERPVIMFTGTGNEIIAVEAMKAGLDDYVIKSAKHFVRLPLSVKQALEKGRLRKVENEAAKTIAHLHAYRELVLNSVADGILGVDKHGCHTFANPAAQQMLGYTLEELLGRDSHALWHHSHRDSSPYTTDTCPVLTSLLEEKTFSGKDFFWRKDGSGFLAEYTSAPIFEDGTYLGAVIIFRDITEREKAQEELRKYRQIVSASEEHMAFVGTSHVLHAVNDAFLKAYNWSREKVIGHDVAELFADKDFNATMVSSLDQAMLGTTVRYRNWLDLPAQGRRYMDVSYYPYHAENGTIAGVVVNSRDITDLKQQEDALRLAEQEWKHTFDSISDFVSIHDSNFRFLKVNKTLADFVGKPAEELIGKHCYEVFHGLSYPWLDCPHRAALAQSIAVTRDIDDPHIGCPLLVTASPIFDERGRVVATIHIAKDISELKKAEQDRLALQTQ
ncbi:MAG: PAS domain S-box protein, partial [Desulfobulbaceae bacterium]|nr:PAS domain S-box protein [Desulfobulbaceae bacterium]